VKVFKGEDCGKNQALLLPYSVNEFVDEDSPVRIMDEIIDSMDHSGLLKKYKGGGAPAYHPVMMLKILILAYSLGIRSSRKISDFLTYDMRFMYLTNMERPDFRTICRFRRDNLDTINRIFVEVVRLSREMDLVLLEHVSVDGTKIEANVSGRETYNMKRADRTLEEIKKKVAIILEEAERVDQEEDAKYGDRMGNEIPEELKRISARKKRLEEAKKKMEETGRNSMGATDLESRVMKTNAGNRPAYNAQAVVDEKHQIIVAAEVTQAETDNAHLPEMIEQTETNTGARPGKVTADGGYYSHDTLRYVKETGLDAYIPQKRDNKASFKYNKDKDEYICSEGKPLKFQKIRKKHGSTYRIYRCYRCSGCPLGKECHGTSSRYKELWACEDEELCSAMTEKMSREESKLLYRLRSKIVEPVFGNIKSNKNLRRLLLRGIEGAKIEYFLSCIVHNIEKIKAFWLEYKANPVPA